MTRIDELFIVHRARSDLYEAYEPGKVAYVSNASDANGVLGFVKPLPGDAVFEFTGIVVNAFSRTPQSCGARVQAAPFVACGRSGNGLLVLEPRKSTSTSQLAYVAAYINRVHGWRFTWYRQATRDRVLSLTIPDSNPGIRFSVKDLLPPRGPSRAGKFPEKLRPFRLGELFTLSPGEHHAESALEPGTVPLVSCGDENNGVVGYYDVPAKHRHCLTIAFNGRPLTAKYHPYPFAAKDDVAIALPRVKLPLTSIFFIEMMLNRERWRYSYYRKCYMEKLSRFEILLPHQDSGALDEEGIAEVVEGAPYWSWLAERLGGRKLSAAA